MKRRVRTEAKPLRFRIASLIRRLGRGRKPKTAAILLAGGVGARFGGDIPKQLVKLSGVPLLIRSALAMEACPEIDETVIVSRSEDIAAIYALCCEYKIRKLTAVVVGGKSRQASALAGASAVSENIRYLAIHDAARALVTAETVSRVTQEAYIYRAASAASPIYDTVKVVDSCGFIQKTLDRESLMAAETPQVFLRSLYLAAAATVREREISVTDDNAILESVGQAIKIVRSEDENFKITTPTDLLRAEAVIAERERRKREDEKCK